MAFDLFMYIVAMLLFLLGSFNWVNKMNAVSAGLCCLTLTLLF